MDLVEALLQGGLDIEASIHDGACLVENLLTEYPRQCLFDVICHVISILAMPVGYSEHVHGGGPVQVGRQDVGVLVRFQERL